LSERKGTTGKGGVTYSSRLICSTNNLAWTQNAEEQPHSETARGGAETAIIVQPWMVEYVFVSLAIRSTVFGRVCHPWKDDRVYPLMIHHTTTLHHTTPHHITPHCTPHTAHIHTLFTMSCTSWDCGISFARSPIPRMQQTT
jgi:hypothetical protein